MTHLGLFEGIGGFSLAARWMGWETVAWCEWNDFGQRVLRHHFPEAIGHGDITQTDFTPYANRIDILTGGFPCQPYSAAGKRKGKDDDRHLWPQMLRAITEIAPRYIVGENVLGLVNWNGGMVFDEVCADLESEGYEVAPVVIPAAAKNAPHGRDRVWFVAYNNGKFWRERWKYKSGVEPRHGESIQESNQQRPTPDTDSGSERSPRKSGGIEGERSNGYVFTEQRRESPELNNRLHEFSRNVAETECARLEYRSQTGNIRSEETKTRREGSQFTNEFTPNGDGDWNATDTDCTRGGQNNGHRESRFDDQKSSPSNWHNFPTQPPICGGDDGLPTELDGITFSKWRAESIKAYGNAIVPQVAYEIFKAIAAYESQPLP